MCSSDLASLIAAILVGAHNPNAGMATLMGATGLNIEQQLKNSRLHENEADYFGISYLEKSGYNPFAMGDFFGRLAQENRYNEHSVPEILRTHPVSQNRLARADDRAQQMAQKSPHNTAQSDALMLMKIRLQHQQNQTITDYDQAQLAPAQKCYQHNHQAWLQKKTTASDYAIGCLDQALAQKQDQPSHRLYALLKAQILTRLTPAKAGQQLSDLRDFYPQDTSIALAKAHWLAQTQTRQQAIDHLKAHRPQSLSPEAVDQTIAHYYAKNQQPFESHLYLARYHLKIGYIEKARHHLRQAEKKNTDTTRKNSAKLATLKRQLEQYD